MKNALQYAVLLCLGLFIRPEIMAQTYTGTVIDASTEQPLPGATVTIRNTLVGAFAEADGQFRILAQKGDTLDVRFINYLPSQVVLGESSTLQIALTPNVRDLDDVVIIGYGQKSRRDITGAVSSIDAKDLEKVPVTRLENALQGQAAGVQVSQFSGRPGSALSVRIRGATSISAGNEPLYVVDGILVLSLEGLNPADVASLEVLKDASAAAIYGARAANGVVLITTKNGIAGQSKISFNAFAGVSQVTRKLPLLNATEYVDLINESYRNAGQGPRLDPADYSDDTNWQDEIFRNALNTNYQVSLSGGSSQSQYYVSLNRQSQEGVVKGSDYARTNARLNFRADVNKNLRWGTNLNISQIRYNNVPDNQRVNQGGVILGALSAPPIIDIYNDDGTYTVNPLQAWENPIANIEAPMDQTNTTRLIGALFMEADIVPDLTFKTSFSTETYFNKNDYFLDPFSTQFGRSVEGLGTTSTNQELVWLFENTLSYSKEVGDHRFSALTGVTAQESRYQGTFSRAEGFPNGAVSTLNAGSRKIDASSFGSQWALLSYLGRVSYSFRDRYLVDANFRADGSSRFGAGNRYAYFPSISIGWRMSEEAFLSSVDAINDAKLRFSAGSTGNQNIGDFSSFGLYALGSNYNFEGRIVPGTRPATIGNDNLRWETTDQYNLGLDLTMLNYRLNVTVDLYYKLTNDLLVNVDLPLSTGFSSGIQNLGSVENRGLEIMVKSYNITEGKFQWTTSANFSINRNKVLDIGGEDQVIFAGSIPENGFSVIVQEGLPLGSFYGFRSLGVNPETGDLVFEDLNEDGQITDDDRTIIGDSNPDFFVGLTNTFTSGPFELDFLLQGVYGNDVLNATRIETEGMFSVKNASADVLDRWQSPGDISRIPRAVFGDPNRNSRISDRFIEDGSYLRLRTLTLTYRLPAKVLSRLPLQQLSVYASGQNLWTLTSYSGFDPEVNRDGGSAISQGIDYGTYPQSRTITGGIQID
ncbi:MAG: TonB-dependent receptor, partial [Bacteroidia bacterium]|nr:TonB-dependent receptor [Bacteroidia bacterium]